MRHLRIAGPVEAAQLFLDETIGLGDTLSAGRLPYEFSRLDNRYSRFPQNLAGDSVRSDFLEVE